MVGGHGDDGALGDVGVGQQRRLDLVGGDVLPAAPQGVLEAVHEVEPAVGVAAQAVPGVEPEVAERLDGPLRHAVVAERGDPRDLRAHDQLTDRPDGHLLVGLGVHQPHVEPVGVDQPGSTGRAGLPVGRHDRHGRLGQAEDLHERLDPEPLAEVVDVAGGRRGEDAAQVVVGVAVGGGLLPDEVHHHADEVGDRRPRVADPLDPAGGGEAAVQHEPGAGDEGRVGRQELGVAVEQRPHDQVGVVVGEPGEADALVGEEVHVRLRHDHALGGARRAGGEQDADRVLRRRVGQVIGDVVGGEVGPRHRVPPGVAELLAGRLDLVRRGRGVGGGRVRQHREAADAGTRLLDGQQPGDVLGGDHGHRRVGGADLVGEDVAQVGGVDRHLGHAGERRAEPRQHVGGAVGRHDQHPVAGVGDLPQARGDAPGLLVHLGEGQRDPLLGTVEVGLVAVGGRAGAQHVRQGPLRPVREGRAHLVVGRHGGSPQPRGARPGHCGRRFSMKAVAPSTMSSEPIAWTSMPSPWSMLSREAFHHRLLLTLAISR